MKRRVFISFVGKKMKFQKRARTVFISFINVSGAKVSPEQADFESTTLLSSFSLDAPGVGAGAMRSAAAGHGGSGGEKPQDTWAPGWWRRWG